MSINFTESLIFKTTFSVKNAEETESKKIFQKPIDSAKALC